MTNFQRPDNDALQARDFESRLQRLERSLSAIDLTSKAARLDYTAETTSQVISGLDGDVDRGYDVWFTGVLANAGASDGYLVCQPNNFAGWFESTRAAWYVDISNAQQTGRADSTESGNGWGFVLASTVYAATSTIVGHGVISGYSGTFKAWDGSYTCGPTVADFRRETNKVGGNAEDTEKLTSLLFRSSGNFTGSIFVRPLATL